MKNTKNKTTKSISAKRVKTFAAGSREGQIFAQVPYTAHDFRNAILIVSLSANIFILTLWLTTQVSASYAIDVARFIVN